MEPQHGLTILDYAVFGTVLLSGLLALMRGFVREVLSLGAWAGAYFIAIKGYPLVEPWAKSHIRNETGATALAAVIVFTVALIILTIAAYFVAKLIKGRALTAIDRSLGFLFGLLRGVLIVCLLYLGASYIPWLNMDKLDTPHQAQNEGKSAKEGDNPPDWLQYAKTRPAMAEGAKVLKGFIPEKDLEKTMQDYDKQKAEAQREIHDQERDMLSNGLNPQAKPDNNAPGYDDKSRSNLNQLINQSKP